MLVFDCELNYIQKI